MSNEQTGPETKGVTVQLLATVDLGPEIEGMDGRQLRMRMVTIAPGGVFGPLHDHKGRPGTVYILQGTITDHRDGIATDYGPGVGWPEDRNTTHWLENRGRDDSGGGDLGRYRPASVTLSTAYRNQTDLGGMYEIFYVRILCFLYLCLRNHLSKHKRYQPLRIEGSGNYYRNAKNPSNQS